MNTFARDPQWQQSFTEVKYKMPVLDDDAMIRHVWDIENVRRLANLRSYYNANDQREAELADLWVSQPEHMATASYGTNWGYYVGMDEIRRWYVTEHNAKRQAQLDAACKNVPGLENKAENLGFGCMQMLPMSTSLVRVADDGQTAKGFWYVIGQKTEYQPDGTAASLWMNGRVAIDFALEDGKWKIWHYLDANDQSYAAGTGYSAPTYPAPGEDPMEVDFGTPTVKMITHNGAYNYADDYPAMPEPYATMTPELSYGPWGHPKYEGGAN